MYSTENKVVELECGAIRNSPRNVLKVQYPDIETKPMS